MLNFTRSISRATLSGLAIAVVAIKVQPHDQPSSITGWPALWLRIWSA